MATLVSPYGNILNSLVKQLRSRVWQQLWELTALCPYTPLNKDKIAKILNFFFSISLNATVGRGSHPT